MALVTRGMVAEDGAAFTASVERAIAAGELLGSSSPHGEHLVQFSIAEPQLVGIAEVDGVWAGWVHPEVKALVVEPAHRRRGVGRALVELGLQMEAGRGRPNLLLGALPDEEPAHAFLGATGFDFHSVLWDLELAPGAPAAAPALARRRHDPADPVRRRPPGVRPPVQRRLRRPCDAAPDGRGPHGGAPAGPAVEGGGPPRGGAGRRADRVLRDRAQAARGRRRGARGPRSGRSGSGRTARARASAASCCAGASRTSGSWASRPSSCPSTAGTRGRSACTNRRASSGPPPASAGRDPFRRRGEPARPVRGPAAPRRGPRGRRDRVLRHLLPAVGGLARRRPSSSGPSTGCPCCWSSRGPRTAASGGCPAAPSPCRRSPACSSRST